jgi:hypothetical protein
VGTAVELVGAEVAGGALLVDDRGGAVVDATGGALDEVLDRGAGVALELGDVGVTSLLDAPGGATTLIVAERAPEEVAAPLGGGLGAVLPADEALLEDGVLVTAATGVPLGLGEQADTRPTVSARIAAIVVRRRWSERGGTRSGCQSSGIDRGVAGRGPRRVSGERASGGRRGDRHRRRRFTGDAARGEPPLPAPRR